MMIWLLESGLDGMENMMDCVLIGLIGRLARTGLTDLFRDLQGGRASQRDPTLDNRCTECHHRIDNQLTGGSVRIIPSRNVPHTFSPHTCIALEPEKSLCE